MTIIYFEQSELPELEHETKDSTRRRTVK